MKCADALSQDYDLVCVALAFTRAGAVQKCPPEGGRYKSSRLRVLKSLSFFPAFCNNP